MDSSVLAWQPDLAIALDRARQERRFILADYSKEH
jgi:hypothetical protein